LDDENNTKDTRFYIEVALICLKYALATEAYDVIWDLYQIYDSESVKQAPIFIDLIAEQILQGRISVSFLYWSR
jgi:hypothetical protein